MLQFSSTKNNEITAIISPEGEVLELTKPLHLTQRRPTTQDKECQPQDSGDHPIPVESWLNSLEKLMMVTVKHFIVEAFQELSRGIDDMEVIEVSFSTLSLKMSISKTVFIVLLI